MKKIRFLLVVLAAISFSLKAQKVVYDNNVQKRDVSSFHSIETSAGIEVIISQGNQEALAVSAGNNDYLDEVKTTVENGRLKIYRSDNWKFWNKWKNWRVKVYVTFQQLDEMKASSGGSINGTDLNLEKLAVKMNSGSTINLAGKVRLLDIDGNSGAQFKGYDLVVQTCNGDVNSGAGVQVTVNREISAKASSGGFIRFKGEGLIRDINVNSGGSVKRQS